jgi:fumarate reductase flavoprotein subunit
MAGLVAAARLHQLGVPAVVFEKGGRPGGSMLLSSGVVWRHHSAEAFAAECPRGDPALQARIVEELDDALAWLEALGAPVVRHGTDNPRTEGVRFDPPGLTEALVRAAGGVRLGEPLPPPGQGALVLATGGFPVRLARELGVPARSNPWSDGDGLDLALAHGAATAGDLGDFYGRLMPAVPGAVDEADFVRLAQLYGDGASAVDDAGRPLFDAAPAWHESDLAQTVARRSGGGAWLVVADPDHPRVAAAREAGATVLERDGEAWVRVVGAVTHTLGGIRADADGRVLRADGTPVPRLYAAGVDVGGVASGGYASGLAQALVQGRAAAETVAAEL